MNAPPDICAHIAVIDDDVGTRQFMTDLLTDEAYAVSAWSGVDDPVTFVCDARPDLIVLDLHLGERFRAWDVIDALCGDGSSVSVPVIICSADAARVRHDLPIFHDRGCVVIEKPFDLAELLDTIRQQLPVERPPRDGAGRRDQATTPD